MDETNAEKKSSCVTEWPFQTSNSVKSIVFPPPASWYRPHVAASRDDMWGYLSWSMVVIVKPKVGELQNWPDFSLVAIQQKKYLCMSFCQSPIDKLPLKGGILVTGCEGGFVRIWGAQQFSLVAYHSHKSAVSAVEWSTCNPALIYSVSDQGDLIRWDISKNKIHTFSFGKMVVTTMALSPLEENIVVLGSKAGNIFIIKAEHSGTVLHKMRHHEELVGITFTPTDGIWDAETMFKEQPPSSSSSYIVSTVFSTHAPDVRVWSRDGTDVIILKAFEKEPKVNLNRRVAKYYGPVGWAKDPVTNSLTLLSVGKPGELVGWTDGITPSVIHKIHRSYIFKTVQCGNILWSLALEPVIVGWNLLKGEVECIIPTNRGISCIMPSPVENFRVAIGGADAFIRVVAMGTDYPRVSVKPPTVTNRLNGKITTLAWHPTQDNRIAFGTDAGVIGIYEWREDSKYAMMFDRHLSGSVYAVDWGPPTYATDFTPPADGEMHKRTNSVIYCVGGQNVFFINPSSHSNPLVPVAKIIERTNVTRKNEVGKQLCEKMSELKWSPDRNYLAIGFNDGHIEIYAPPNLFLRCWIKSHARSIQYFAWRPFDFLDDQRDSGFKWLASASNDGTTRIFNLNELYEPDFLAEGNTTCLEKSSSIATFEGHNGLRAISLAWSPHDPSLLAVVSYDRTAIIWNINDAKPISRYMEHKHRLVACAFHPTNPYLLISSSDELVYDFSMHMWDYRDHPYQEQIPNKVEEEEKMRKALKIMSEDVVVPTEGGTVARVEPIQPIVNDTPAGAGKSGTGTNLIKAKIKEKWRSLLPASSNALLNTKHSLCDELRYLMDSASSKQVDNQEPKQETQISDVQDSEIVTPMLHLGLLLSKDHCLRLLSAECQLHETGERWTQGHMISVWKNSEVDWIRKAISEKQVTETMVAFAATISNKLMNEAIQAYAKQLEELEDYCLAATYLSKCGKEMDGVKLLMRKTMYREAVAYAKCYFPEDDEIHTTILENWLERLKKDGNYELMAKIHCSMGQHSKALQIIELRNMPYAWVTGIFLAEKCNEFGTGERLAIKYMESVLQKNSIQSDDDCLKYFAEYEYLMWLTPFIITHRSMLTMEKKLCSVSTFADWNMYNELLTNFTTALKMNWDAHLSETLDVALLALKIKSNFEAILARKAPEALMIIIRHFVLAAAEVSSFKAVDALNIMKLIELLFEAKPVLSYVIFAVVFNAVDMKNEDIPYEVTSCYLALRITVALRVMGNITKDSTNSVNSFNEFSGVLCSLIEKIEIHFKHQESNMWKQSLGQSLDVLWSKLQSCDPKMTEGVNQIKIKMAAFGYVYFDDGKDQVDKESDKIGLKEKNVVLEEGVPAVTAVDVVDLQSGNITEEDGGKNLNFVCLDEKNRDEPGRDAVDVVDFQSGDITQKTGLN